MEALYAATTTAHADTPDDVFDLTVGVRQGGHESPLLYNLYMDYVMRVHIASAEERGIQFVKFKYRIRQTATTREQRMAFPSSGDQTLNWSGYADDLELFFEDEGNLDTALTLLDEIFSRFRLKINVKKTETMIFGHKYAGEDDYPGSIVSLNNTPVNNTEVFRYLGDNIHYDIGVETQAGLAGG